MPGDDPLPRTPAEHQAEYRARKDRDRRTRDHRAFVGPIENYDLYSANQFTLLTTLGLREHHYLLDIGCGSLRAGRLFIPYLLPGRYFGIEPEAWLVEEGVRHEVGADLVRLKRPMFSHAHDFTLSQFNRPFDFLLAHSIFSHATPHQIGRCLSEARKVMSPSSIFAATFVMGHRSYAGDEWWYSSEYTQADLHRLVEGQGLALKLIRWPHPDTQRWAVIFDPESRARVVVEDDWMIPPSSDELARCQQRLAKLEAHPYVRLGLGVRRLLRRLGCRRAGA